MVALTAAAASTSISGSKLNVKVSAKKEVRGSRLPAFGHSVPYRFQRLDIVLLIMAGIFTGSSIVDPTIIGGASLMVNPSTTEMINLPWAQNGCFPVVIAIHNVTRHVHCRGRPIVSLLQSIETRIVVQNVVFVEPLAAPNTLSSVQIDGAKEPLGVTHRSKLSVALRRPFSGQES